jgi:serine/threonine-protein kinase HipA
VATRPALDVFTSGRPTGALARSDVEPGTFLFGYREDCAPQDAVSLTMPVVRDQYDSMGALHPIFEMNLPEGALLEKLRLRFAKTVEDFDDLALLSIVGQSQIGRLRYALPGLGPAEVPAQDLGKLLAYRGTEDLFASLLDEYATYSGVSGVQPKVLLRADDERLPRATVRGATHLVKSFDPREFPELAANEFFCLRAAALAGISVPEARLAENRRVLVLRRFDLRDDGTYVGCEDFCVLSGLRAHGRYHGDYETIARRISQFVSPEQQHTALEQFFAILTLCCVVENGDAHLKNFAVLYEDTEGAVSLAPAYDIVSTTPYQPRDVLALTLGGTKAFPERSVLIDFGRRACGLSKATALRVLERVATGVDAVAAEISQFAKDHRGFGRAAESLQAAFVRGLKRSIRRP